VILADTGLWLALANRRDAYHAIAKSALSRVREPLVTTWPVMTETCHLLLARMGVDAEAKFVASGARGAYRVAAIEEEHLDRVTALIEKYRELPMDLADASLVVLAEELGSGRIFSTDHRDFRTYRWKRTRPFENLLPEARRR
jgi:predicted nucleic acid-binding protein